MFKKFSFVVLLATLAACSNGVMVFRGGPGEPGANGTDGANGHSLVSYQRSASELECSSSGTAVDIYMDLDDSSDVSEGDVFQNGLVACNGTNGQNGTDGQDGTDGIDGQDGEDGTNGSDGSDGQDGADGQDGTNGTDGADGAQGPAGSSATVTGYDLSSGACKIIIAGSVSAKKNGSSGEAKLYANTTCSGSSFATLNPDTDELFMYSDSTLFILEDQMGPLMLRKLVF